MIEFNYDKIMRPYAAVHCDEEWKANNLLKWADAVGLSKNNSYLKFNNWHTHKKETCYNLYYGKCSFYNYYKDYCKIYKYEDVLMEENKSIKDGWYYIKLNQSKEIEDVLPPTRCVYVKDNKAFAHDSFYCAGNNMFDVTEDMIESPAYIIGKEYEFSDDEKEWVKDIYCGYDFNETIMHNTINWSWSHVRKIEEPEIEIKVKINGKEVKLSEISEETLLKIRQNN